jgi:hypothetical protein
MLYTRRCERIKKAGQTAYPARPFLRPMRKVDLSVYATYEVLLARLFWSLAFRAGNLSSAERKKGVSCLRQDVLRGWCGSTQIKKVLFGQVREQAARADRQKDDTHTKGVASWSLRRRGQHRASEAGRCAFSSHNDYEYSSASARASSGGYWNRSDHRSASRWSYEGEPQRELVLAVLCRQRLRALATDAPLVDREAREGRSRSRSSHPLVSRLRDMAALLVETKNAAVSGTHGRDVRATMNPQGVYCW